MMEWTAAELLALWERGALEPWAARALTLLDAAHPELPSEDMARLTIGERDVRLLEVREALFGPRLDCLGECGRCGEPVEASLSTAELRTAERGEPVEREAVQRLRIDEYDVAFRLPNSYDLLALEAAGSIGEAERRLLACCVVAATSRDRAIGVDELPGAVVTVLGGWMAEADPHADVQVVLQCPRCANRWEAGFDIVTHLWAEIDAWARRTLEEVHTLASAYGWSEGDILALSRARRQAYLDLLGSST